MDASLEEPPFAGFGPNPLDPYPEAGLDEVEALSNDRLKQAVREKCPTVPGVYGMINRDGHLIYVGKSKALRKRLLTYFSPRNAEEKAGRIITAAQRIVWETQPSEFAALLREQQLIRRWTPRWNVQEIPKRQLPVYLCLGKSPAPYFFLAKMPPADVVASQGPFLGAARMNRAVDSLNNFFRLRDCSNQQPLYFADQMQLFDMEYRPGCFRHEIGKCSGPCVSACTRAEYDLQVSAAESFLDGYNFLPIDHVRESMQHAAETKQYELASRMRDDLRSLEYLYRKLNFLADARTKYTFIYSVPGYDQRGIWYLIRQGEVYDATRAPTSPAEYAHTRRDIAAWRRALAKHSTVETRDAGKAQKKRTPEKAKPPKLQKGKHASASRFPFTLSVVAGWLRKRPDELQRTFQPAEAGRKYRRLAKAS